MKTAIHIGLVLGLASFAAGCATTQAKAPVERPPLEVPPVPPRVIAAAPQPPPVPEPVPELPPAPPSPRPRPQQRETTKPDPKPETPPVEAPPAPPPAQTVPPLRTNTSPDSAEALRLISDIRNRAHDLLNATDYGKLNPAQKAQYDNAKRFIDETDEALKAKNFEFAKGVAEKAERLARELQGR